MTPTEPTTIATHSADELGAATRILTQAFDRCPLLRYVFAEQLPHYGELLSTMFRLSLSRRIAYEGTVLGVSHGATLAGVAPLTYPSHGDMPAAMRAAADRFTASIGTAASERFGAYEAIVERHRPERPHLYLGVLGVLPYLHGRGYGRALLDAVHALAHQHPTAEGVYLDTQRPENVALYAHFGYKLIGVEPLGPLQIWCMHRPSSEASHRHGSHT